MVKEVEFSNESEVLSNLENYSNAPDQPLYTGHIEDDGVTLKIKVHVPLLNELASQRKLILFYGSIDFDSKLVDYINIGETALDYRQTGNAVTDREYTFDISRVMIIPRKIYSTGGTSEITIELYTYESNLSTDYGSKTLSVPYSINNDVKYEYDRSTDGVYRLIMGDFDPWVSTRAYGVGDIVVNGTVLSVSLIDENLNVMTTTESWALATDDDILNYSRGITKYPPVRAFITDIMISRYSKYKLIRESIMSTSFKGYDDDTAYELTLLLQNLRERAKYKLITHKPIDAAYTLQTLKVASSPQTDVAKIHTYNIKYTT